MCQEVFIDPLESSISEDPLSVSFTDPLALDTTMTPDPLSTSTSSNEAEIILVDVNVLKNGKFRLIVI